MFNNPYNPYLNNYNTYTQNYANQQYPQQNYNQVPLTQMQQPQQQQTQTNAVNTNKIYVSGIDEVKSRIQAPNSDMLYLDNEKALLYQKIVDGTGKFTVKSFSIVEYTENSHKNTQNIDLGEYVLKSDFDALQAQINALENAINEMKNKKADNFVITEVKK